MSNKDNPLIRGGDLSREEIEEYALRSAIMHRHSVNMFAELGEGMEGEIKEYDAGPIIALMSNVFVQMLLTDVRDTMAVDPHEAIGKILSYGFCLAHMIDENKFEHYKALRVEIANLPTTFKEMLETFRDINGRLSKEELQEIMQSPEITQIYDQIDKDLDSR